MQRDRMTCLHGRTYVVRAFESSRHPTVLGTVTAKSFQQARTVAVTVYNRVLPGDLRVQAAGSVSTAVLIEALASDGRSLGPT